MAAPARWLQIKSLFFDALDQPTGERAAFLSAQTVDDPELHQVVSQMLLQHLREVEGFEPDPAQPTYPARFGPYKVTALVASTLTTLVLKAIRDDGLFDQTVAIKLIHPSSVSPVTLLRLESERRILATLNHPSICRLLDSGQLPTGQHYLILEWIEGTSFLDHARSLDLRSKLLLFCDICSVIEAAHRLLVVHRDLKPAHILITPQGNLKILDFGIAKLIQSTNSTDSQLTQYGQAPLTPAYASAEQWRGDPATPSFDVFSLGVLFAELLTGNHPFGASPALPHEWASRIAAGQPVGLTGLKADLRAIAAMAIEQNPSQRYLSVEAFRRDIENYLDHKPLLARPDSHLHDLWLWLVRNKTYLIPVSIILAFALFEAQQYWARREADIRRGEQAQVAARQLLFQTFEALTGTSVPVATRRQILYAAIKQLEVWEASSPDETQLKEIAALYGSISGHLGEGFGDHLEDYTEAEKAARRSVSLWDLIPSAPLIARINNRILLGDVLFSNSKWAKARKVYSEASTLMDRLPDAQSLSTQLYKTVADSMQGDILLAEGKPEQALEIQKSVLARRIELSRQSGGFIDSQPVSFNLANVQLSLAQTFAALRQTHLALDHARDAVKNYEIALETKPGERDLIMALILLGDLEASQGNSSSALLTWRKAERVAAAFLAKDPPALPRQKMLNEIRTRLIQR
jgi:serine/threonine-protein kinase